MHCTSNSSGLPPQASLIQPGVPAEAYGENLDEEPRSPSSHFSRSVSRNPSSTAVISIHQVDSRNRPLTWSYAHLYSEAGKLAAAWKVHGLRKGSVVIVLLPNCLEYALSMWAAARLRAVFVPLDIRITPEFEEMCEAVEKLRPEGIVVWDRAAADSLAGTRMMEWVKISTHVEGSHEMDRNTEISKTLQHMLDVGSTAELEKRPDDNEPVENSANEVALITLTSGTTGRPKACPHTGVNISAATYTYARWRNLGQRRSSLLAHLPNYHIFSCNLHITWWRAGGTIVYPSRSFDAEATLNTLETGYCTDMSVVPSIFSVLTLHPSFDPHRIKNLEVINTGASLIPPTFTNAARDKFSVKYATVAFGMSEGMSLLGWHLDEEILHDGSFVSTGKAGYGVGIKICAPGSREPLNRGAVGELHASGPSVISNYIDSHSENFYLDSKGRHWMTTGDQARMDMSGSVFITGRYKDMIIRGGKNISPALVEACLNKIPALQAQIVGIPDDLAGEVPVAVIVPKTCEEIPAISVLQEKVRVECGVDSVPTRVVSLRELNLEAVPITLSGKVKKTELRQAVLDFLKLNQYAASSEENSGSTLRILTSILARLLGRHQEDVPLSTSIDQFADSITLVRFRYEIKQRLDKHIPEDLLTHEGGVQILANLLDSERPHTVEPYQNSSTKTAQRRGPPSCVDMIHVLGSPDKFQSTCAAIEPVLQQFGLCYETDVQNVYPVPDLSYKHLTRSRDYSYNLRLSMLVTQAQISRVREAIEATLVDWAVFRCIAVDYSEQQRLFVEIRGGERLQKLGILPENHQHVANLRDLKNLARSGLTSIHAHMPGPLFRAILVEIQDSGNVGVIIIANHAILDALSMAAWREDLEYLLGNPSCILSRVSYQSFANTHYNYRTSASAAKSVGYFVNNLRGVNKLSRALWPAQRASEWYIGNDVGWKQSDGALEQPSKRRRIDASQTNVGLDGIEQSVHLPHLPALYSEGKISAATLFKGALALLTVSQTGEDIALMGSVQAGRQWPFVEPWMAERLANPLDIAGSTHTNVPHIIRIDQEESVMAMLKRLSREQDDLTLHAHAPYALVDAGLSAEDRAVLHQMKRRQTFNWIPDWSKGERVSDANNAGAGPKVHVVQSDRYFNFGILWNCSIEAANRVRVHALYDDVQLQSDEMMSFVERLLRTARWMHNPVNWEQSIRVCLAETAHDTLED